MGEPVTVVVRRRVRAGREKAYERWLAALVASASTLPGYLGTQVLPPPATGPREYTSVFRFDGVESLRGFEDSELRQRALEEVADYVEADAVWEKHSGLELWFSPPPGTVVPQPDRLRMALLLIVVVYVLVLVLGQAVGWVLGDAPYPLRLLITIVLEVSLLTWVVMPPLTRKLARWLYPARVTR